MKQTGECITAGSFGTPGLRRFFLILMKDPAHPEPAGEDRDNSGDEARDERGAERVHSWKVNMDANKQVNRLSITCADQPDFGFRISDFGLLLEPCLSFPIERAMRRAV